MSNEQVDAAFRRIIEGVAPPVEMDIGIRAENAKSRLVLKGAVMVLCENKAQREILQLVYDIGVVDGELKAANAHIERLNEGPRTGAQEGAA